MNQRQYYHVERNQTNHLGTTQNVVQVNFLGIWGVAFTSCLSQLQSSLKSQIRHLKQIQLYLHRAKESQSSRKVQ